MARKIVVGSGKSQVTISPEMSLMVERILKQTSPKILDRLEDTVDAIEANAVAKWPVGKDRKGREHSKDLFEKALRIAGTDAIEANLTNTADYSYMIKSQKNGLGGKSPYQELMRKPAIEAGEKLAEVLAADIAAIAGGK